MSSPANDSRTYHVVAMSFPIVYSIEGDHDPNGLLYTLNTYKPLLDWAKDRWEENGKYLTKMHRRRQLMEVLVDGLPRYERMREILGQGPVTEHYLLNEFGAEAEVLERETADAHRPPPDPRARAVRQNYRATVNELVPALRELTGGRITRLVADTGVLHAWRQSWLIQLRDANRGIETQLKKVNEQWPALLAEYRMQRPESQLTDEDINRLLLNDHSPEVDQARDKAHPYNRFNPLRPLPLVRPLVLRACRGETLTVQFENRIRGRRVGMHVQGDGLGGTHPDLSSGKGVRFGDGAHVGENRTTTGAYEEPRTYTWTCDKEGVWPINDLADIRGTDRGTNNHGLFAALVIEPQGARWYDPETGLRLDGTDHADGLYVDVVPIQEQELKDGHVDVPANCPKAQHRCEAENRCRKWRQEHFVDFYSDDETGTPQAKDCSFREFTVFFHDEPETVNGIPHLLPHSSMPLSYRAEPMHNRVPYRLRRRQHQPLVPAPLDGNGIDHSAVKIELDETLGEVVWVAQDKDRNFLERVSGEEQHHSSWLFGEPVTPVLRAYRGDPSRVRLVHAGVKETHVFHLHVHQWRAVAQDVAQPSVWKSGEHRGSQLLDSVSIGPQTAMTIDPLYGSGSRQRAVGDIIWHCHLYPHFHHGMWGLWRSFDREVTGKRAYPDGTPCPRLVPLPGRNPEPSTDQRPGFPWFIDATYPRKSPPPPVLLSGDMNGRRQLLKMGLCSKKERAAFDPGCVAKPQSGALFVDLDGLATKWNDQANVPERRVISYDIEMTSERMTYNSAGWYDPMGHHYRLTQVAVTTLNDQGLAKTSRQFDPPAVDPVKHVDAFFPRANHGDIVELRLHNLVGSLPADHFDLPAHPVECGLHVHLVKFDVLASDGSATGWNYLSGASSPGAIGPNFAGSAPRNVSRHRWVVDEEFGTCFFHDHLLANTRQKRGLFAALIAEPNGSRWYLPDQKTPAWIGSQAVVIPSKGGKDSAFQKPLREAGLALGDYVPLCRANGEPLNEPYLLGGDDDPGVMGVNYRCAPMEYRGKDPSEWFSSNRSALNNADNAKHQVLDITSTSPHLPVPLKSAGDPDTPVIWTYPGEQLRIRLFQGSHEEQHSFMVNGLRWRKDWCNPSSPLVNQQTLGISEAFTADIDPADASPYGVGDYLWQFTVMDDLWLGCWGIIRAMQPSKHNRALMPALKDFKLLPEGGNVSAQEELARSRSVPPRPSGKLPSKNVREYVVVAQRHEHLYAKHVLTDPWGLIYRRAENFEAEIGANDRDTGNRRAVGVDMTEEPLVLRAHPGEWIKVTLINEVLLYKENLEGQKFDTADPHLPDFGPEISAPRLPVEHRDHLGYPDRRTVSPRVSLHPSLLRYDVVSDDGAYVGHNHDSTVAALDVSDDVNVVHGGHDQADAVVHRSDHGIGHRDPNWREYWWYADDKLAPDTYAQGKGRGQVCYLFDMGDIRNHRHHGLIGALVVEPSDITPMDPESPQQVKWSGAHVHLTVKDQNGKDEVIAQEFTMFLQDGLRQFLHGDIDLPLPDISPSDPPVDAGQKAISYRSPLTPNKNPMASPNLTAPILEATDTLPIWWRLVCAGEKPRNHTFTLHGFAWDTAPWVRKARNSSPEAGSVGAISSGFTQDLVMEPQGKWDLGDHAYRSGSFRWAVSQGMWGIMRIKNRESLDVSTKSDPTETDR